MAFSSKKLAKALALAVPCSSFVCTQQVFCVKQWALGDTERFDDKESLCNNPIIPFRTKQIYGFFDANTKFLCIDGVGEINEDILKNIKVVPVQDVQSISIGKEIMVTRDILKNFCSLESVILENCRLNPKSIRNKKNEFVRQNVDSVLPYSYDNVVIRLLSTCSGLKKVIIIRNITDILDRAFYNFESLEEVQLPDSLRRIRDSAFSRSALKKIVIPKNVTEIGDSAFSNCESLEEVQLPDSLLKIGNYAFYYCSALKKIVIPKNVTEIGEYAFCNCESLEEVQLPDWLHKIGDYAFGYCENLKSVRIPKNVTEIGNRAFYGCRSLKEVQLPDSLRKIGSMAFKYCSMESIRIPKNVTEIGSYAFCECDSLKAAYVPANARIEIEAFPNKTKVIRY